MYKLTHDASALSSSITARLSSQLIRLVLISNKYACVNTHTHTHRATTTNQVTCVYDCLQWRKKGVNFARIEIDSSDDDMGLGRFNLAC